MEKPAGGTSTQSRVAIVGTGLAGLTTAYLLHRDQQQRYAITLFEQVRTFFYFIFYFYFYFYFFFFQKPDARQKG
jgi:hypothetical protein